MINTNFSAEETMIFLTESGIINSGDVQKQMTKKQHKDFLKSVHTYSIWQGSDGRWRTYITSPSTSRGRKMVVRSSEDALEDFLFSYYQAQIEKPTEYTLRNLYPDWLEYKRLHTNAETYIMRIHTDWKTYYENTPIIDIPIKKLDKLTLDKWVHKLIKDHHMTKTKYYNVTVIMRQVLLYAVDMQIINNSPFSLVKVDGKRLFQKVRKKPDHTQVFLKEEVHGISSLAMEDFHNRTVHKLAPLALLFQFQTGLRIGEVCAVSYEDIETPNYIHIQRMLRRDTNEVVEHAKTDCGDRYVFLTEKAKQLIATAQQYQKQVGLDCNNFIFSTDGKPLSERSVSFLYEKYCRNLGIIQKSSHKARKTYISSLVDGRVNINTIREMAGHADEKTTLKNYVFDRSTETEKNKKIESALTY